MHSYILTMEFDCRHIHIHCNILQPEEPLPLPIPTTSPPSSAVNVRIEFLHQARHKYYIRPHHDTDVIPGHHHPQLFASLSGPTTATSTYIAADDFQTYCASHGMISQYLSHITMIQPQHFDGIAEDVVCCGQRAINTASDTGRAVIQLRVVLMSTYLYVQDEGELVARGVRESEEERERMGGDGGMVAASEEAVRGLERKRVAEVKGESCRVCLEEFVMGEKLKCMPCNHVFHEVCIETWLGKSHYCPICRFEMPTAS